MSIQIQNLCKSFHDNQVLRNVDLDVKEREIVVLMGLSGSGKTTLLRCLCDLKPLTAEKFSSMTATF